MAHASGARAPLQMACGASCGCAKCSAGRASLFESIGLQKKDNGTKGAGGKAGEAAAEPSHAGPPMVDADEVRRRLGSGAPLPVAVAQRFSAAYGHDLSAVRVHADSGLAAQVGARAFTTGRDVVFAPGEYRPGTGDGDRLIAHELAHVVQQAGGAGAVQGAGVSEDAYEAEADRAADVAVRGGAVSRLSPVAGGRVQHDLKDRVVGAVRGAGQVIGDVAEAGRDVLVEQFWKLVRAIAPTAEPYLRDPGRLWEDIKAAVGRGIDALVGGVLGALPKDGIFGAVATFFKTFVPALARLTKSISKDDHAGIVAAVQGAIEAFSQMSDAVLAPVQGIFKAVSGGLAKAFEAVGKPILDVVKSLAKDAWSALEGFVDDVVSIGKKVGTTLSGVWKSIKEALGFGGDDSSKGGLWDRIKKWAGDQWEKAKPTVLGWVEPLKTVAKVLVVTSPFGPMVLALKYGPKVVHWLKDLWKAIADPNNIPRAREKVVGVLHGLSAFLQGASAKLGALANDINKALEGISKPLAKVTEIFGATGFLKLVAAGVRHLAEGIEKGIKWVGENVPPFVKSVGDFFTTIWAWAKPILDVVVKVGFVVANPLGLPMLVASHVWRSAPRWLKVVVVSFVLDILIRFLDRLPDGAIAAGMGPLASLVKHGVLGFLRKIYGESGSDVDHAVAAADRVAKLAGGGGIDFALGFGKGILTGIWEGLVFPIELVVHVIEGVAAIGEYLDKASENMSAELRSIWSKVKGAAAGVKGAFWPAIKSVFSGGGSGFQKVLRVLEAAWGAISGAAASVGSAIAGALMGFIMKPDFELGSKLGWVAGTVMFEVALAVLTGGASAALSAARGPIARILQLIVKIHTAMGKVFEAILHMLGPVQKALGRALKAFSEIPAVKTVITALERLFKEIEAAGVRAISKLPTAATAKGAAQAGARAAGAAGRVDVKAAEETRAAAANVESKAASTETKGGRARVEEPPAAKTHEEAPTAKTQQEPPPKAREEPPPKTHEEPPPKTHEEPPPKTREEPSTAKSKGEDPAAGAEAPNVDVPAVPGASRKIKVGEGHHTIAAKRTSTGDILLTACSNCWALRDRLEALASSLPPGPARTQAQQLAQEAADLQTRINKGAVNDIAAETRALAERVESAAQTHPDLGWSLSNFFEGLTVRPYAPHAPEPAGLINATTKDEFIAATGGTGRPGWFEQANAFSAGAKAEPERTLDAAWQWYQHAKTTQARPALGEFKQVRAAVGARSEARAVPGADVTNLPELYPLNVPQSNWQYQVNDAWIVGHVENNSVFEIVSNPTAKSLLETKLGRGAGDRVQSVFGRELQALERHGYAFVQDVGPRGALGTRGISGRMVPPSEVAKLPSMGYVWVPYKTPAGHFEGITGAWVLAAP
ncbi:DUF4157 domain-containing protein [Sorangium sp. So ce375]|uniref:eCIS core domain-containing protein n=1 Tax=Sorangium sp. So ce375 TaxID=3133306 RepID=UPI003F5AED8C